jgi:hypothetical protein
MEIPINHENFPHLSMATQDFANWGIEDIAYLKPESEGGVAGYAIYSADGRHLAFAENRNVAKALVLENQLVPLFVQ